MAKQVLKLTTKERLALCWLAGLEVDPPAIATLLDLQVFDLVGVLEPDAEHTQATFTLTDAGKVFATVPAPRKPRGGK